MTVQAHPGVTGLILAGGRGRRLQGEDKGLVEVTGAPLIAHVIRRFSPQVQQLLISANRNLAAYGQFGHEVLSDEFGDFEGPLAGLRQGLRKAATPLLATVPCDAPLLPVDLVQRLLAGYPPASQRPVIAHDGQRLQPLFGLYPRALLPSLEAYLAQGERRVQAWVKTLEPVIVDFTDQPNAFLNANRVEDIQQLEGLLTC